MVVRRQPFDSFVNEADAENFVFREIVGVTRRVHHGAEEFSLKPLEDTYVS